MLESSIDLLQEEEICDVEQTDSNRVHEQQKKKIDKSGGRNRPLLKHTMPGLDIERLYDEHADAMFAFVLSMARNETDTRDILQEVFTQLVRHPDRLEGIHNERPFLLKLCYHALVDQFRKQTSRERVKAGISAEDQEMFAPAANPDEAEFHSQLAAALADLPEDQRTVVHLKLWQDLTFLEISEMLGLPANTAASRYRYGIDKLRDRLRPLYDSLRHGA